MSRRARMFLKVSIISICLIIAGLIMYFTLGRMIINHIFADLNYAIVSGQTKIVSNSDVKIDLSEEGNGSGTASNNGSVSEKTDNNVKNISEDEWTEPVIGEQYAILTCDSIGLDVPVYCGDTDEILSKGVGQSAHSTFPGQAGVTLIGGHDTTFFAPLEKMKENDEVILSTTYGTYTYKVSKIKIIDGTDIDLNFKEDTLILYTCYPFGEIMKDRNNKILFECSLVDGPSIGGGNNE